MIFRSFSYLLFFGFILIGCTKGYGLREEPLSFKSETERTVYELELKKKQLERRIRYFKREAYRLQTSEPFYAWQYRIKIQQAEDTIRKIIEELENIQIEDKGRP